MGDFGGKRTISSTTSFARVVYFHYVKQAFIPSTNERPISNKFAALNTSVNFIEDAIESIEINKSMSAPSGTFDITLMPTQNWKQEISPGDWLVIYLYNENTKFSFENNNIAMIGNVDRVSRTKQKDENTDKTIVRYHVSGRDFGKVFEETDIFANPYIAQSADVNLLNSTLFSHGLFLEGGPSDLVSKIIDVFLSPVGAKLSGVTSDGNASSKPLGQWELPKPLLGLLGGLSSFHDVLDNSIEPDLPGYTRRSSLTPDSSVGLWSYMMRSSNEAINEMWVDLKRNTDGSVNPSVFLRPRPSSVFFEDSPGGLDGHFHSLVDLVNDGEFIEVSEDDIYYSNLGRDEHNYANMIWLRASMLDGETAKSQYDNVCTRPGQIGLPMYGQENIMRGGLKKANIDLLFSYAKAGSATNAVTLYKSFIAYLYDVRAYNRLYETGTVEGRGDIKARCGLVLRVLSENPPVSGIESLKLSSVANEEVPAKLYYTEGYKHSWKFPGMWTTTYSVTQGQYEDEKNPFIDLDNDDFGRFDKDFDQTNLIKTNVPRGQEEKVALNGIDSVLAGLGGLVS